MHPDGRMAGCVWFLWERIRGRQHPDRAPNGTLNKNRMHPDGT